jgi:hypothetical protein
MPIKLFALLVADTRIDQYFSVFNFYEQASHRPITEIILICWYKFIPDHFWDNAKHGTAIQFEVSRMDW